MRRERTHVKTGVCGSFVPRVVRHAAHYGRRDGTAAASGHPSQPSMALLSLGLAKHGHQDASCIGCGQNSGSRRRSPAPCCSSSRTRSSTSPVYRPAGRVSPPPVRHLAGSIRGSWPSGPGRRGSCRWLSRSGSPRIPPPWRALLTLRGSNRSWTQGAKPSFVAVNCSNGRAPVWWLVAIQGAAHDA
jgi:hypothetical protein